ncbi:MAG: hypothetical protein O2894_01625 [Planctomycetota bacterium]|nr:hypothetical protein [Planctomycetota bacterium]
MEDADALVAQSLGARLTDADTPDRWAAQAAAVEIALANGWNFYAQRIETAFEAPLAELALALLRTEGYEVGTLNRLQQDWRLRNTDAFKATLRALAEDLRPAEAVATLPLHRLSRVIQALGWHPGGVDDALWRSTVDALRARHDATADAAAARVLEDHVLQLFDARSDREQAIAFLRATLTHAQTSRPNEVARLARDLFGRLLQTPARDARHTPEREDECMALLPLMLDSTLTADGRSAAAAGDVRRLCDQLYTWRYEQALGTPEARKELSRAAVQALAREARTEARAQVVARIHAAEQESVASHRPWLQMERLGYAVEHGEALAASVTEAQAVLAGPWERADRPLDRVMRERAAVILAYAATRGNTTEAIIATVLQTFERGASADRAARQAFVTAGGADESFVELLDWQGQTWRLLLARDDPQRLETSLRAWTVPAKVESRWRVALGYLLAELGRVAEATEPMEAAAALDELTPVDYAALGTWYLVLGDDVRRARANQERLAHMNEGQLAGELYGYMRAAQSRTAGVPGDFDPACLPVLQMLMQKARYPGNYLSNLTNFYAQTKEFRLLAGLADGLVGHTPEAVYGFVGALTQITGTVHEEATLDAWSARLAEVRTTTKSAQDRRALALAVSLIEARASLVPESDPRHGTLAVEALQSAFQEDWAPGERERMAALLHGLGKVASDALHAERLRQLEALRRAEPAGSLVRVRIAQHLAEVLWNHAQPEPAIDLLESELNAMRPLNDGRVPLEAVRTFDLYVHWIAAQGRFAEAERVILREFDRWDLPMRRRGLTGRLHVLYVDALRRGGRVSLGQRTELFRATARLLEQAIETEPAYASTPLGTYLDLHRAARDSRSPADAGAQLERATRGWIPAFLARTPIDASGYVSAIALTLEQVQGPRSALAFFLDRHDAEPRFLERLGTAIWSQKGYYFAGWRAEAGSSGDLDARLLALTTQQLEANLLQGGGHGSWFWRRGGKWSWPEKFDAYADVAGRVAELHEGSEAIVVRCATLLHQILGRHADGLDMLTAAHARGVLSEGSRWTLTHWQRSARRLDAALATVDGLLAERPDNLGYRLHRAEILADQGNLMAALEALQAVETDWRAREAWGESIAARLGDVASRRDMPAAAEKWLEEAIGLREDGRGPHGGRDRTLGGYYRMLALARGKLGKTDAAVRAASAALLSMDPRRQGDWDECMSTLHEILVGAKDLPGYLVGYDAEVERTGLDTPVLRKAFAAAFHQRSAYAPEIAQLLLARDLDEGDADVHARLVAAYDAHGKPDEAVEALFGSIRLAPHRLESYTDLAARYTKAGDAVAAERALTTLVEESPHQPGGHRALALAREAAERRAEAAVQWRQVVRTDTLDPTGHLALARVLIALGEGEEARTVLQGVLSKTWEARFGDVAKQATDLLQTVR